MSPPEFRSANLEVTEIGARSDGARQLRMRLLAGPDMPAAEAVAALPIDMSAFEDLLERRKLPTDRLVVFGNALADALLPSGIREKILGLIESTPAPAVVRLRLQLAASRLAPLDALARALQTEGRKESADYVRRAIVYKRPVNRYVDTAFVQRIKTAAETRDAKMFDAALDEVAHLDDPIKKVSLLVQTTQLLGTLKASERMKSIAEFAFREVQNLPDRGSTGVILTTLAVSLHAAGLKEQARDYWKEALLRACSSGVPALFQALDSGKPILAAVDGGDTQLQICTAICDIESWWELPDDSAPN